MSFTTARLAEFNALRDPAMFGVVISNNGQSVYGIQTPAQRTKQMRAGPYEPERTSTFDILRTDMVTLGITERSFFYSTDALGAQTKWEVNRIEDDPSEPSVRISAVLRI